MIEVQKTFIRFALVLFLFLPVTIKAANECQSVDHTGSVSNSSTTYSDSDNVYWLPSGQWNRKRYYIQVGNPGHVEVSITNDNGGDVRFNASTDSCPDYQGAGTSWSHDFSAPGDFNIDVTAWTKKAGWQNYTITVTFTPDTVLVNKTVNNTSPSVGDTIVFTITTTNKGTSKRIEFRDGFPTDSTGESYWGTTANAFDNVSFSNVPSGVSCSWQAYNGSYILCTTDSAYSNNQSFTVTVNARVAKTGHLCNRAHGYKYDWQWRSASDVCVDATSSNNPPTATDDSATVDEDGSVTIDVLANDSDPDGDTLTIQSVGTPAHGAASASGGQIVYTPNPDYNGPDSFTYTISDGNGGTASATVHITVNAVNDAPVANDVSVDTTVDTPVTVHLDASDPDGEAIQSYPIQTGPSHGQLSGAEPDITYTPDSGYTGTDSFTYQACDSHGACSNTATVTITIGNNVPIHATDNAYLVTPDTPLSGNMIVDDTGDGVDTGTNISVISVGTPTKGSLTWSADGNFTYTPDHDEVGIDSVTYTIRDASGETASATLSFNIADFTQENVRDFNKVWIDGKRDTNIYGDLTVIGNQSLCWKNQTDHCVSPPFSASNNSYYQENINLDQNASDAGYANSTSADLILGPNDEVVDAWLYWIGRINNEPGKLANADRIRLKTPDTNGTYVTLYSQPDKFSWKPDGALVDYGCAVNIKKYVKHAGTYWVADLQATEMYNQGSGWAIAVIIRDKTNGLVRSMKNISLYDGFIAIYNASGYQKEVTQHISGFRTPKDGNVSSNFIFFVGESDRALTDWISLTDKQGALHYLEDSLHEQDNVANGTISRNGQDVTDRNPNYSNTLGVDIDELNVSSVIQNNQTETDITVTSGTDRLFYAMFGFATELYIPKVCYDYTIDLGTGRPIHSLNIEGPISAQRLLTTKVLIKSLEGDFNLQNSTLALKDLNATKWTFEEAQYSPNDTFAYRDAVVIDSDANNTVIAIGEDDGDLSDGGTVETHQLFYAKYIHKYKPEFGTEVKEHISIDFSTHLDFGSGPVPYTYSTSNGTLERCPTNPVYNPIHYIFNVERPDSDPSQPDNIRYPLYTQISGRDFDVSVVSYDKDDPEQTADINDTGVELELFDAGSFENNASAGFDTVCLDYDKSRIVTSQYVPFEGVRHRVDLHDSNDFAVDIALKNAAFRVWYITDANETFAFSSHCYKTPLLGYNNRDECFADAYRSIQTRLDPHGYCASNCNSADNNVTGCYECLKVNFGHPVCSRDNFAIRPESYRITVVDDKESDLNVTAGETPIDIGSNDTTAYRQYAAGYDYRLEANATLYQKDDRARKYYRIFNAATPLPTPKPGNGVFLEFAGPSFTQCADTNSKSLSVIFDDGYVHNGRISHNNVGDYNLSIVDSNWTIVDQLGSDLKPFPNVPDCAAGTSAVQTTITFNGNTMQLAGCLIKSDHDATHTPLVIRFEPYSFDVNATSFETVPTGEKLLMSDLASGYYSSSPIPQKMLALIKGRVKAKAKGGGDLSNFSGGCAATKVELSLNDVNLSSTNPPATTPPVQYTAESNGGGYIRYPLLERNISQEANFTVPKSVFLTDVNHTGEAEVSFFSTLKKPLRTLTGPVTDLNPVKLGYTDFNASAPDANSTAELSIHTPKGAKDLNASVIYYYAKIMPERKYYDNVQTPSLTTKLYVALYCDELTWPCGTEYNLTTPMSGLATEGTDHWHLAAIGIPSNELGDTNLSVSTYAGQNALPQVSVIGQGPATLLGGVVFDRPSVARREDINISVSGPGRPSIVKVQYDPVPWLDYYASDPANPNADLDFYRVKFIGETGWGGVGHTGQVGSTPASSEQRRRIMW
ncbi:Ig-like domain-containing protein [Nitratifractor sp.]